MNLEYYKPECKVIAVTQPVVDFIPDSEGVLSYCARVSNPKNQENFESAEGLLNYCARNNHWSIFEMVNVVIEIKTPRDISRQVLRHKSACFQEFSQRYSEVDESMFILREARMQDTKNRQNSVATDNQELKDQWETSQKGVLRHCVKEYQWALSQGIAKECARVLLPEGLTLSTSYMNANMRTWIHYCGLRGGNGTQEEHTWISNECKKAILSYFPNLEKLLDNKG